MSDLNAIDPIQRLLGVEDTQRDEKWENEFLAAFPGCNLEVLNDTPVQGPDGWPYLVTQVSANATEPAHRVLQWLSEHGVGLVVNPKQPAPDFVLTYGMIWNFRETGRFIDESTGDVVPGRTEFVQGTKVLAGPPSDKYLPPYVRAIMREFFKQQGKAEVKILVLSEDQKHYDLCFSLESLGSPPRLEHHGILEAVSWFLPAHHSLVLASEAGLPPFHPL